MFIRSISVFLKKKRIKHNKHINNQNQEAFIVIIISYTFSVFSSVFVIQNNIFLKNTDPKSQIILF